MDLPRVLTTCEICSEEVDVTHETAGVVVSCSACGGPVIVPAAPAELPAEQPAPEPERRPVTRGALFSSLLGRVADEAQRRLP